MWFSKSSPFKTERTIDLIASVRDSGAEALGSISGASREPGEMSPVASRSGDFHSKELSLLVICS